MARIYIDAPLAAAAELELPASQSRHVQVLRLQPGDGLTLFNGAGGEWHARVARMGRTAVTVRLEGHVDVSRELSRHVTLVLGMPANERMDALVEKATELGVAAIQPLVCERSVLRLAGERATRRLEHWQAVAVAASEQCGRTRVPRLQPVRTLRVWLEALADGPGRADMAAAASLPRDAAVPDASAARVAPDSPGHRRVLLSPSSVVSWSDAFGPSGAAAEPLVVLSGPEGGLSTAEEDDARRCGFAAVSMGTRILRADTAPLAVLAWCALEAGRVTSTQGTQP